MNAIKYLHKILGFKYSYKKNVVTKKQDDSWFIFSKFKPRNKKYIVNDFDPMNEDVLTDFSPYIHIDLFREGITKKTIKKFGLGYSYRWKRTIFPVRYWLDGTLMGYNARSTQRSTVVHYLVFLNIILLRECIKKLICMDYGRTIRISKTRDLV